jgi:dipeptidase E
MKATLVLVGGGEIGNGETLPIDTKIRSLCAKGEAKLLFLPTAAHDVESYTEAVKGVYGPMHCQVEPLYFYEETPGKDDLIEALEWSDIIYIGGGNTRDLLRRLKETGLDRLLIGAMNKRQDLVVAGYSAGASMWCKASYADCDIMDGTSDKMTFLGCLDYLPFVFNPHAQEEDRKDFVQDFRETGFTEAYSLENNTALLVRDKKVAQIIKEGPELKITRYLRTKKQTILCKSL